MRLQITIFYGFGYKDILNYRGLALDAAREQRDDILKRIRICITERDIFYAGEDENMIAVGPDLLAKSHFKCEILQDE